LVSGAEGLDLLRTIIRDAGRHLGSGGALLLEHGYQQAAAVRQLLTAAGFTEVQSHHDYAGIERASQGRWP
jgi:release factor glutamine methyltransferase